MSINERLYACASLAGPLVDGSLGHADAVAFHGLLSLEAADFAERISRIPGSATMPMRDLVIALVKEDHDDLAARFAVAQWSKRKADYDDDCASWKAAALETGDDWREKPMTSAQRFLIADTARLLEIEFPENMNRGEAADWLNSHGAHLIFKLNGEDQ